MTDILLEGQFFHDIEKKYPVIRHVWLCITNPLAISEEFLLPKEIPFRRPNQANGKSAYRVTSHCTSFPCVPPVAFEFSGAEQRAADTERVLLIFNRKHGCCRPLDRERDSSLPGSYLPSPSPLHVRLSLNSAAYLKRWLGGSRLSGWKQV